MFAKMFRFCSFSVTFLLYLVNSEQILKQMTKSEFQSTKQLSKLTVVYFAQEPQRQGRDHENKDGGGKRGNGVHEAQAEKHALQLFQREYEKSASVLAQFDITLSVITCKFDRVEEYCSQPRAHMHVFVFKEDVELMKIGIESMFDVDSIVSNVLQLALLRELPILQSVEERSLYENQAKGQQDIIFSFQAAIGTPEHRTLAEVAFAYHNKIRFALSTDSAPIEGLPDSHEKGNFALWVLQCQKIPATKSKVQCPPAKYYGPLSTNGIATFIQNMDTPAIQEVKDADEADPHKDTGLVSVYVFYDKATMEYVQKEARNLAKNYKGSIGIRMVNVEQVDSSKLGLPEDVEIPVLTIRDRDTGEHALMDANEEPRDFIKQHLLKRHPSTTGSRQGSSFSENVDDAKTRLSYLADVEKQDDEVAQTVSKLRKMGGMDMDAVVVLNETSIDSQIRDNDLLVVYFYLHFDALSSGGLYSYITTAELYAADHADSDMPNPFAVLNCFDWPRACTAHNVTTWPIIRIMRRGQPTRTFRGVLSPDSLKATVELYSKPALTVLSSVEEVESALDVQNFGDSDVAVVGFTDDKNSKDVLMQAAEQLHGELSVMLAHGDVAKAWSQKTGTSLPSLTVLKRNDPYQPKLELSLESESADDLATKLREKARPVLFELTPARLPALYVRKATLVILFCQRPSSDEYTADISATMDSLGHLAAGQQFPGYTFTWMDLAMDTTKEILVSYTGDYEQSTLVLLNLNKAEVFVYTGQLSDGEMIGNWLSNIQSDEISYTKQLPQKEWRPHNPGFNFLQMMDEEGGQEDFQEEEDEDEISSAFHDEDSAEDIEDAMAFQAKYDMKKAGSMNTVPESKQDHATHIEL